MPRNYLFEKKLAGHVPHNLAKAKSQSFIGYAGNSLEKYERFTGAIF